MDNEAFQSADDGNGYNVSVDGPAQTRTAKDRFQVVRPFLSAYYSQGVNASVEVPSPTLTTKDRVAVVLPHSTEQCIPACEIRPEDTPAMCRIKEFCALYGIVDITMRMLRISEMKRIQGFGDDYVLVGTQEEQKKYLGNAVVTQVATAMCEALAGALTGLKTCRQTS